MPYRFPSGRELVRSICNASDHSEELEKIGFGRGEFREFKMAMYHSAASSVDAFVEHRPEFMSIGKAAIAEQLIRSENREYLFCAGESQDWYRYLLDRLNAPFEDFGKNSLCIITFNYDRSLEEFLFTALVNRYGKSPGAVAEKLTALRIVHVYGHLGFLDWQVDGGGRPVRPYEPGRGEAIKTAAAGIKIMSEDVDDSPELAKARELIMAAERVYFLGFGYHDHNMRRLKVPLAQGADGYDGNRIIRGTCLGFTEPERAVLQHSTYRGLSLGAASHTALDFLRHDEPFLKG